jgi:hypothetical protein
MRETTTKVLSVESMCDEINRLRAACKAAKHWLGSSDVGPDDEVDREIWDRLVAALAGKAMDPALSPAPDDFTHADAAGALCVDDGNGCCGLCGVAMTPCDECKGVGYHAASCPEND